MSVECKICRCQPDDEPCGCACHTGMRVGVDEKGRAYNCDTGSVVEPGERDEAKIVELLAAIMAAQEQVADHLPDETDFSLLEAMPQWQALFGEKAD